MPHCNTLFGHLLNQLPRHQFENLVSHYGGDRYHKRFSTWNQFQVLLYAQCGSHQSLRDIETSFLSQASRLYHLGLPDKICRNTLANANAKRDSDIYQDFFYKLVDRCKDLTPKHKFRFKNPLYTFDATTISLCLSIFPWARIRHKKGAIKMHVQLDYSGEIPVFMTVTRGDVNDVRAAKARFEIYRDSIYCFDRGYLDYGWFNSIDEQGAFFVTRRKGAFPHSVYYGEIIGTAGIVSDEQVYLKTRKYPKMLRLIRYYDSKRKELFEFITNNFELPARTIADIYKSRWQIEAFFKWIKQNLKIKTFLGTNENAVLTQIWVAMCYYLLLAYLKYQTKYKQSLFYLHRLIRAALLQRLTLIDLLHLTEQGANKIRDHDVQLEFAY
jgi:hypothetical protein